MFICDVFFTRRCRSRTPPGRGGCTTLRKRYEIATQLDFYEMYKNAMRLWYSGQYGFRNRVKSRPLTGRRSASLVRTWEPALAVCLPLEAEQRLYPDQPTAISLPIDTAPPSADLCGRWPVWPMTCVVVLSIDALMTCVVILSISALITCVVDDLYGCALNQCLDDLCDRRPVWLSFQSTL